MKNTNLHRAKNIRNNEFYTRFSDVTEELSHYKEYFKNKIIYCNCDNPIKSAFWKYFHLNFSGLGLKKLIATYYDENLTYKYEYKGENDEDIEVAVKTKLVGNGDFRNSECLNLLEECDIVVTNPPFSLFREFIALLMKYKKQFLVIGSANSVTCKDIFHYLRIKKFGLVLII